MPLFRRTVHQTLAKILTRPYSHSVRHEKNPASNTTIRFIAILQNPKTCHHFRRGRSPCLPFFWSRCLLFFWSRSLLFFSNPTLPHSTRCPKGQPQGGCPYIRSPSPKKSPNHQGTIILVDFLSSAFGHVGAGPSACPFFWPPTFPPDSTLHPEGQPQGVAPTSDPPSSKKNPEIIRA